MNQDFLLFAGTGNPSLTHDVAAQLGVPVGACAIGRFPDGEVIVTDSVAVDRSWPRLRVVSIAPLLAAAIRNILTGGSFSDLYQHIPTSARR